MTAKTVLVRHQRLRLRARAPTSPLSCYATDTWRTLTGVKLNKDRT